mmetsp:Transcript_133217/g.371363  ORF Transcript_133217/g.371363 Transcript_133217/m.371363 type:complete len:249 (-) Transcript_133217:105-851(-)
MCALRAHAMATPAGVLMRGVGAQRTATACWQGRRPGFRSGFAARSPARTASSSSGSVAEALAPGLQGGARQLSDIAKVPLLMRESPARVREIWLEKFRDSATTVAGALAQEEYRALVSSATACPMFLVPVPRGSGYLNMVWQAQRDLFLYQTLESLQRGTGSVDFGVALFTELLPTHGLVLLHGELQTGLLTKTEAERVVRYTREAYADPARFAWVKRFNLNPREFDYEEFLAEFRPLERWHAAAAAA